MQEKMAVCVSRARQYFRVASSREMAMAVASSAVRLPSSSCLPHLAKLHHSSPAGTATCCLNSTSSFPGFGNKGLAMNSECSRLRGRHPTEAIMKCLYVSKAVPYADRGLIRLAELPEKSMAGSLLSKLTVKAMDANCHRPLPLYGKASCNLTAEAIGVHVKGPADLDRVCMQADATLAATQIPNYKHASRSLYHIAADEGLLTLWKRSGATVAHTMASNRGMFASYHRSAEFLRDPTDFPEIPTAVDGASKSNDTETNQKGEWRKWIEARLEAKDKKLGRSGGSSTENHSPLGGELEPDMLEGNNHEGDHHGEKGLLGDLEQMNKGFHSSSTVTSSLAREDKKNDVVGDDFLQELEKIERSARKAERFRNDNLADVRVSQNGRNGPENDSIEFNADIEDYDLTKGTESDLDDDEAIFYRDGIGFVTNKGVLDIPGLGDLETQDLDKPYHFRPDRLYYPGQTYVPEDLDISQPTEEPDDVIPRARKIHSPREVWERSDFRNVRFLSQFISETSRLYPRRKNTVSAKAQRKIVREIKISRAFGLIPFTSMGEPPYNFLKSRKVQEFNSDEEDSDEDDDYDQDNGERTVQEF